MKTITKIEVQKKDSRRVSVFVDGEFSFGMQLDDVLKFGLSKNKVYSDEEFEVLLGKLLVEKAKFRALDYISYKMRTTQQVRDKLKTLEYDEWVIDEVIAFLEKYGYLNDQHFANRYIEYQMQYNKKSLRKVKSDLYEKGISKVDLENPDQISTWEMENVTKLLEKYHYDEELDPKMKLKITNRILSRGFDYYLIRQCIGNLDISFKI
ncbi:MAG: RecX family transcriptional regulator [Cellulosilyticaceae bacterium]